MTATLAGKKLHELLTIAVDDCMKLESDLDVVFDFSGTWHEPRDPIGFGCVVCMAGAVMDQTLGVDRSEIVDPGDCGVNKSALFAINNLRHGFVRAAAELVYGRSLVGD